MDKPFRINFVSEGLVSDARILENVSLCKMSGVPYVSPRAPHGKPLAIVGGGVSTKMHMDELKAWPGDIWAINGTCSWLADFGIESTLLTVDPDSYDNHKAFVADMVRKVEKGMLATCCSPELFAMLRDKDIEVFHVHGPEDEGLNINGGTTSACRAHLLALATGYHDISYFGCEGSWELDSVTHVNKDEPQLAMIIHAGGKAYVTNPQLMIQCENLAAIIKGFPNVFKDRSGGLLGAMIEHPDSWEVVAFSEAMQKKIDPTGGKFHYKPIAEAA